MHKQTATAMPNLEVMPLPKRVLPKGGRDVPTFTVIARYKYVKTCAELPGYRDSAAPSSCKNARIHLG